MSRGRIAVAAAAAVALVVVWYMAFFAPKGDEQARLRSDLDAARSEQAQLEATVARLQHVTAEVEARKADLARLQQLVPPQPDVARFIHAADEIADRSGVRWLGLVPSPAVADPATGLSTIAVTMQVEGSFFEVVSWLKQLETLSRLVVVDAIDLTAVPRPEGGAALTVGVSGRIFTSAPAPAGTPAQGTSPAAAPTPPAGPESAMAGGVGSRGGDRWR